MIRLAEACMFMRLLFWVNPTVGRKNETCEAGRGLHVSSCLASSLRKTSGKLSLVEGVVKASMSGLYNLF